MEPSRIRTVDLLDRIERGEKTVLIDTRNSKAWAESDQKLPKPCESLRMRSSFIPTSTARPIDRTYCS